MMEYSFSLFDLCLFDLPIFYMLSKCRFVKVSFNNVAFIIIFVIYE